MNGFLKSFVPAVLAMLLVASALEGAERRRGRRGPDTSPAIGAEAPDFELVAVKWLMMSDAQRTQAEAKLKQTPVAAAPAVQGQAVTAAKPGHVRLSSFRGKQPVLFVLTSYT